MAAVSRRGSVQRTVGGSLIYVADENGHLYSLSPDAIIGYRGEPLSEIGAVSGASVTFDVEDELVTKAIVSPPATTPSYRAYSSFSNAHTTSARPPASSHQSELHPDRPAASTLRAGRALPPATRRFAKIVDTGLLRAGDLLLSRDLQPDRISRAIIEVQQLGGYADQDSVWTHAAMYVGDGASVVEATFDTVLGGGSVRLTRLDEYSTGEYVLRFRRPRFAPTERDGWRMCVRALARLKDDYDIMGAAKMWFQVVVQKAGFWSDGPKRTATSRAVVCSTLYSDAYNEAFRRTLGELCGICVPAWLSSSEDFTDVQTEWVSIS